MALTSHPCAPTLPPPHATTTSPLITHRDDFRRNGPSPSTLTGALVGGPDRNDNYNDDRTDYVKNEVSMCMLRQGPPLRTA